MEKQAQTTQHHQGFGQLGTQRVKEENNEIMSRQVDGLQAADPRALLAAHEIGRLVMRSMSRPWKYMMSSYPALHDI